MNQITNKINNMNEQEMTQMYGQLTIKLNINTLGGPRVGALCIRDKYSITKHLQNKIENKSDTTDRLYEARLGRMQGGTAIVHIDNTSDAQVKEKQDLIIDDLNRVCAIKIVLYQVVVFHYYMLRCY